MSYSEKVNSLLEKGVLVGPEFLDKEKKKFVSEKETVNVDEKSSAKVKVLYSYDKKSKKRVVNDFVQFFNHRFKSLERIIRQRPEMQGLISLNKLRLKSEKDNVSIIGMIKEKNITKNNNVILKVEDLSGQMTVLIHKNNVELHEIAKDLVLDEVIGVVGVLGKDIIFANNLVFPEISLNKELKKGPTETYAVFISDLHFGSKVFLKKEFEKFIFWLNGEIGTEEQRNMAKKTKYIFLTGDLVEGVGIYPSQEEDLEIKDIKDQYKELAKHLLKIKGDRKLIITPGNHDAGRIAEPQPPMYNDFAEAIWKIPNTIIVSNPALVNIDASKDFSGLDILLYHGFSLIYYANNVVSLRNAGGQKRVDLIMKFLLQRRHLAPTHESNLYIPDAEEDPLVISTVPDVFVTGHIHRATASQYRNVTILNTSCWDKITEDQEKRGLEPQPARAFVLNIQTRKVKLINFLGE
ncbi:metallophosphoesterase [Candidatus Woesearchaeota archaeon]|nr:metallophosphoesterase [Candidatus Woesearchaeota archaeon]